MARAPRTAAQIAEQYARDVIGGRIVVCELTRLACRRHLDDLKRWGRAARHEHPYWFDGAAAQHVVDFVQVCRHYEGEWAGQTIRLEPWQVFVVAVLFGWMRADGARRFRTAYLEVARKNAKSTLSAALALYMLIADGEAGGQVYSVATTYDQAHRVFEIATHMVEQEPEMAGSVEVWAKSLVHPHSASSFKPLHSKSKSNEGWNTHCAVMDELHAHPTAQMWDVIALSRKSRRQPLLLGITTAGDDQTGICYEQRDYVVKVLRGLIADETYFGVIYTLDAGDDWQDPAAWPKANPNLGVSVNAETFAADAGQARATPRAANEFRTKSLNVWVGAQNAYYDSDLWRACGRPDLSLDDMGGRPLVAGMDLAMIRDVAAVAYLFREETGETRMVTRPGDDGEPVELQVPDARYSAFMRFYLPENSLTDARTRSRELYRAWADSGHLVLTPGNSIDYQYIKADILATHRRHPILSLEYDAVMATQLVQELTIEGVPVSAVAQGAKNLNMPMQELDKLMADGRLVHDANPMMAWMIDNTVAVSRYGGKYIGPAKPERQDWKKIDGVVALIMALRGQLAPLNTDSIIPAGWEPIYV
jgi:phage terminase large subunit-like protein